MLVVLAFNIVGGWSAGRSGPPPPGDDLEKRGIDAGDTMTGAEIAARVPMPFIAVLSGVAPAGVFARYQPLARMDLWVLAGCNI